VIRAVLFDIDGTLYHQPLLRAAMASELIAAAIASGSIQHTRQLARTLSVFRRVREELRERGESREPLSSLQFSLTAARAGVGEQRVRDAVEEWMFRRPQKHLRWARRPGIPALLAHLTQRGIAIGALSDYPGHDKLMALGLASHFSIALCTTDSDINAFKPHPRGFLRACELWGLAPEEVLYVGDRPEIDAAGAIAAGLRAVIIGRGAGRHHRARYRAVGNFGELRGALSA
jgi:HAD superfamily hydrolase (TIGR01549 family)